MQAVFATLATPPMPGAVAIIDLCGEDVTPILSRITGIAAWQPGVVRLADFAGIDQGLAVLLDERHAQLMPHAGPRVVQRMMAKLIEFGEAVDAASSEQPNLAGSRIDADMHDALWRAASPAAVDLLLAQPRLWGEWLDAPGERGGVSPPSPSSPMATGGLRETNPPQNTSGKLGGLTPPRSPCDDILAYSHQLERLVTPPSVVVVGSPNVGKSTLSNTILGRTASIVADMPGTTRDFVSSPAEIDGVALRWLDTPGVRVTPDVIESNAIALSRNAIANADVLIVVRDGEIGWPSADALPRTPDIHVIAKSDRGVIPLLGDPPNAIRVSSHTGVGIDALTLAVLTKLGLTRADRTPRPWAFSSTLRAALADRDWDAMRRYLAK